MLGVQRYYVIKNRENPGELCMVEGVPDPTRPDKPSRDSRNGPMVFSAPRREFWQEALNRDFVWTASGFGGSERYRIINPEMAEKIRNGEGAEKGT